MENASPSPLNAKTCRSGRDSETPLANGKRAAMDEMGAVGLDEIREAAGAADAGDRGHLLVPDLALFDQLEIQRRTEKSPQPGHHVG
jgi:hypothetical protein